MDRLLRPHQAYAAAYIDDIIIHSASWDIHLTPMGGPGGAKEGRPHRPPSQVSLGTRGGLLPGLQSRTREHPAPGGQDPDHPRLAPPHHQETGEIFPWVSGILSKVYSWFRYTCKSPP